MNDDRSSRLKMNNNPEGPWSSGLIRSYSEHADVLLRYFQEQSHYPNSVKYTSSTSGLYNNEHSLAHLNPNYQNEIIDSTYRSWNLSNSLSESEKQVYKECRKIREGGCGDSNGLSNEFSELSLTEQQPSCNINEYESGFKFESVSLPLKTENMRTISSIEHNESHKNVYNNDKEYQLWNESKLNQENCSNSTVARVYSSPSTLDTNLRRQRLNITRPPKNISYENWVHEKQRELQRRRDEARLAEIKRCEAEERKRCEKETKQVKGNECFLKWVKQKKHENKLREKLTAKELEFKKQIYDVEKKSSPRKTINLKQWRKKKDKQQKASETEIFMKQKKLKEEKEKRFQESLKAYEKWFEKAKNTPRPATQGLLPHQKAKPAFTNPTPWKSLLDNVSDGSDTDFQSKTSFKIIKNYRNEKTCIKRKNVQVKVNSSMVH